MRWMQRLAVVMSVLAAAVGTARAGTGDVNGDGSVTRADAAMALRIAGGLLKPTFGEAAAASVTGDAAVTLADALRIARTATGRDTAPPAGAMWTSFAMAVSANATRNVALPGGYVVVGRLTDRSGRPFAGGIAFRDTASGETFGGFALDEDGDYIAVLPPGTYQAIAISLRTSSSGAGEFSESDTTMAVGSPVTITANRANLNFTRPDLPSTYTVTFDFTGPSSPYSTSARVILWDTEEAPPTYGLNYFETEVLFTPAARPVPRGSYWVDVIASYPLSSGLMQNYYLYFDASLDVTGSKTRTLTFPRLYELYGDFTGVSATRVVDVYAEQVPVSGKDVAGALVNAQGETYRLAMPSGALILSVGLTTPYVETMAERLLSYTMPGARTRKDISLPGLPDFRTITGQVIGPDGLPVANASVTADTERPSTIPSSGVYAFHASTTTDASGRYTMRLPNGTYNVTVAP